MKIKENLYRWLQSTGLFDLNSDSYELSSEIVQSFESGHSFIKLIKRLNQIRVKNYIE